jgi:6-phosphogluconolactonase
MMELPVRVAKSVRTVPASLAVFRVRSDGKLDFIRKYNVPVGSKNMFFMGITALP